MVFAFRLNRAGVNELLHSPGVQADLKARADRVAESVNATLQNVETDGIVVIEAGDANRARYVVVTATPEAMEAEAKDRRLTAAIDLARG